jgi:hypothetical protein
MKDNVLKKEFVEKDVQRLRNLVQGKYADKSQVSIGYSKEQENHHIEGDIWVEGDKTWTIKDGVKQNVTKLDKARETINFPIFCPSCKKPMKPHLDKKWFNLYKHCFNCQIDAETQLRIKGEFQDQVKNIVNSDLDGIINDFESWIDDQIQNDKNESFITEAGDVEKWVGSNKDVLLKSKKETIEYLKSLKKE